jgi:Tol biopolymer transport system component
VEGQVPPDEAWRTLTTDHFRVTFPDRLEALGRRAAARAEQAYQELAVAFIAPPSGKIDLLLTDHTDVSNGFARVTPSNRITVYARPPVDDPALGYADEWLELVVTHELAHVFHLDHAGWLGRLTRGIFGRVPITWPAFPGTAVPRWTTEGLATWYESSLTGAGRTRGSYHEMVLRTAALEGRFEQLDQASGDSPLWPGGDRAYVYGSLFFDYLLERHGADRMGVFVDAVAGQWVPYRLDAAARTAFGTSVSQEWSEWREEQARLADSVSASLTEHGPITVTDGITSGARVGLHLRVSPDGERLAFTWADGRSDSQVRVSALDGSGAVSLTRTNGVGTFDWTQEGALILSQLETDGPYRFFRDLHRVGPDGRSRRLTRGARLSYPSVEPGGSSAVAVQDGEGTNALVRVDLTMGTVTELTPPDPEVHWGFPAVSPDGRWIAASRWTPGARMDVVLLDRMGRLKMTVTDDRAMDFAPTWSPEGNVLLWASDRSGILNVLAVEVDPDASRMGDVRMATNVATGAAYPSVDPSGRWLYVSAYHVDGWEVERLAYDPAAWGPAPDLDPRFTGTRVGPPPVETVQGAATGYSALPTLLPRYWEPLYKEAVVTAPVSTEDLFIRSREVLGPAFGAETSGFDLVERHRYDAFARVYTRGGKADAGVTYSFAGLGNPVLSFGLFQFWGEGGPRLGSQEEGAPLDTLFVRQRERSFSGSLTLRRSRWRSTFALSLSGGLTWQHSELLGNDLEPTPHYALQRPDRSFSDLRATASFSTARSHAFQLGAAEGVSLFLRGRLKRELDLPDTLAARAGKDGSVDEVVGTLRAYQTLGGSGHAAHVVGVRGAFGVGRGPGARAGHFRVGGASGRLEDISGLDLFGATPLLFPVRGYERTSRFGRNAWTLSAEYRFPLWLVNRGLGAWPLHVDRVVGSLFFDAGNAWGPELGVAGYESPRRSSLASVGAEITTELLTLWKEPLRVRTGIGVPLVDGSDPRVYVRVGLSF